jgi:hypothetical protein
MLHFNMITSKLYRPITKGYPGFSINTARLLRLVRNDFPHTGICPQCGYNPLKMHLPGPGACFTIGNSLVRFCRLLLTVRRRNNAWVLALYQRRQGVS